MSAKGQPDNSVDNSKLEIKYISVQMDGSKFTITYKQLLMKRGAGLIED